MRAGKPGFRPAGAFLEGIYALDAHTFAHLLLRVTHKNLAIVQKVLGHSSMSTTAIYVKAVQNDTIAAVRAISSPWGKADP